MTHHASTATAQRGTGIKLAIAFIATLFCLAPVPGDVGGCGQEPDDLDARAFFAQKAAVECRRCGECGVLGGPCDAACSPDPATWTFPAGCFPLVHDGEVCLDALYVASCDAFAAFVDERAPAVPTECDFCPRSR